MLFDRLTRLRNYKYCLCRSTIYGFISGKGAFFLAVFFFPPTLIFLGYSGLWLGGGWGVELYSTACERGV